jgi:hypothetical protein
MPLRHRLKFTVVGQRAELVDEAIENEHASLATASPIFITATRVGIRS